MHNAGSIELGHSHYRLPFSAASLALLRRYSRQRPRNRSYFLPAGHQQWPAPPRKLGHCSLRLVLSCQRLRPVFSLLVHTLGARAYGNGCLHVGNISGFVTKFFQCSDQIHFIHISNVTSTFASNVIANNISFTFQM